MHPQSPSRVGPGQPDQLPGAPMPIALAMLISRVNFGIAIKGHAVVLEVKGSTSGCRRYRTQRHGKWFDYDTQRCTRAADLERVGALFARALHLS